MPELADAPAVVARLLRARLVAAPLELAVHGESMSGVIASGSVVTVEEATVPRLGEIWALIDNDGVVVVHRIRGLAGGSVIGRGSGNEIDDAPLPVSHLVGRVVSRVAPDGTVRVFSWRDRVLATTVFGIRQRMRWLRRLPVGR